MYAKLRELETQSAESYQNFVDNAKICQKEKLSSRGCKVIRPKTSKVKKERFRLKFDVVTATNFDVICM